MRFRLICEIVESSGKAPVSKWLDKHLDPKGRAKLHSRFNRIEADETINPNWLKRYTSLNMWEIRFDYGGSAFRILCEAVEDRYIMLLAAAKDEQITEEEEARAVRRREAIKERNANVREYPLPGRPSEDMAKLR